MYLKRFIEHIIFTGCKKGKSVPLNARGAQRVSGSKGSQIT
jgi:hypothetical protein